MSISRIFPNGFNHRPVALENIIHHCIVCGEVPTRGENFKILDGKCKLSPALIGKKIKYVDSHGDAWNVFITTITSSGHVEILKTGPPLWGDENYQIRKGDSE